jgi:hypothetical protein
VAVISRLVVASDGYFSRVRRQCLDDGPPEVSSSPAAVEYLAAVPLLPMRAFHSCPRKPFIVTATLHVLEHHVTSTSHQALSQRCIKCARLGLTLSVCAGRCSCALEAGTIMHACLPLCS